MFAHLVPGYNKSFFEKFKIAGNMLNKFKTEKIDGEKYYKISIYEENFVKTVWISKKTLNPSKAIIEFLNGSALEYKYDLKFTAVKLSSIELPKFDGYEVKNSENN